MRINPLWFREIDIWSTTTALRTLLAGRLLCQIGFIPRHHPVPALSSGHIERMVHSNTDPGTHEHHPIERVHDTLRFVNAMHDYRRKNLRAGVVNLRGNRYLALFDGSHPLKEDLDVCGFGCRVQIMDVDGSLGEIGNWGA